MGRRWKISVHSNDIQLFEGDLIAIAYRRLNAGEHGSEQSEHWIRACIIESGHDVWPLARLSDGQLTEVRPFMTWRLIDRAARFGKRPIAA